MYPVSIKTSFFCTITARSTRGNALFHVFKMAERDIKDSSVVFYVLWC